MGFCCAAAFFFLAASPLCYGQIAESWNVRQYHSHEMHGPLALIMVATARGGVSSTNGVATLLRAAVLPVADMQTC